MDNSIFLSICAGKKRAEAILFSINEAPVIFKTEKQHSSESTKDSIVKLVQECEKKSGCKVGEESSKLSKKNIDHLTLSFFVDSPMRTIALGISEDISLKALVQALQKEPVELAGTFHLMQFSPAELIDNIRKIQPELIIVAGGTELNASRYTAGLAEIISSIDFRKSHDYAAVTFIFAGSSLAREKIQKIIGPKTNFFYTDNILEEKKEKTSHSLLTKIISDITTQRIKSSKPGLIELTNDFDVPLVFRHEAFFQFSSYFAETHPDCEITTIDSDNSFLTIASSTFKDKLPHHKNSLYSKKIILEKFSYNIAQYFREHTPTERSLLRNAIYNRIISHESEEKPLNNELIKALFNFAINHHFRENLFQNKQEVDDLGNIFNEKKQQTKSESSKKQLIIIPGELAEIHPSPAHLLSDISFNLSKTTGFVDVFVDKFSAAVHIGSFIKTRGIKHRLLLENSFFSKAGTIINPTSKTRRLGENSVVIKIIEHGNEYKKQLKWGESFSVDLAINSVVVITPSGKFDFGAGYGKEITKIIDENETIFIDLRDKEL